MLIAIDKLKRFCYTIIMATNRRGIKVKTPGYGVWADMLQRCKNPNLRNYSRYGGRGIKVCERWLSFDNFHEDMGDKPKGKSLDRIDSNADYEPKNCKWSTPLEQSLNTNRNHRVTFNNETMTITEWARKIGLNPISLFARFGLGWSVEKALTTPKMNRGRGVSR